MNKIILSLLGLSLVVLPAHANMTTGFYSGAHTGVDFGRATVSGNNDGAAATPGNLQSGQDNPNVGAFLGYGWVKNRFYLAGEVGYTYTNTKLSSTLNSPGGQAVDFNRPGYIVAAVKFGYLLTPETVAYVRIGGHYGRFRITDRNTALFAPTGITLVGSKYSFNVAPGVGMQTKINNNLSANIEWTTESSSSVRASYASAVAPAAAIRFSSVRVNSVKIGLIYAY